MMTWALSGVLFVLGIAGISSMGDTPNSIFSDITTPVHISGGFFTAGGNNQHIHNARGPVVQWNVSGDKFAGNPRKSTPSRSSTSDMNAGQASPQPRLRRLQPCRWPSRPKMALLQEGL
ncbi:hypothetical protein BKA70DRAFT_852097 [Coprinopsis sp. MPI-PUGE-AT-0042]|nr:hypothetical protein BKA70DRAFT_852097 [Coprinopsis sp. MPI-PUGE-AT-0042]